MVVLEHDVALHSVSLLLDKYIVHDTGPITSLLQMSLLPVELRQSILCFHEPLGMDPDPREIMPPVCPHEFLCVVNDAFTHHFITEWLSVIRVSLTSNAPLVYFITCFRFSQSSQFGAFTLVVRKSTALCKSWRTCPLANKTCAMRWWNCAAYFSGRGIAYFSSQTLNKFSVAGVRAFVVISSRNYSNTFFMYGVIDTSTCPWVD